MTKADFLRLMRFPKKWDEIYPNDLFNIQINSYQPGNEKSPEHFRFGAFLWWLSKDLSGDQLLYLKELAALDEDFGVREDVINRINARVDSMP